MRTLITGASGFLGSALAHRLASDGHDLALLVRPTSSLGRLGDLGGVVRAEGEDAIRALVLRFAPDVIIHTACSYGRKGESLLDVADANLRFGLVLLSAVAALGREATFVNTGTVLAPEFSAYALSKHQFAAWGRLAASQAVGVMRFVDVQLQHIYGPGDDASKFPTYVLRACLRNETNLALTAGEQRRDFIYIDDVVSAYSTLVLNREALPAWLSVDVGSGEAPTIREFVQTVHRLTGSRTRLDFGSRPYRPNEAMLCRADITRMAQFGWRPAHDLVSGITETIREELRHGDIQFGPSNDGRTSPSAT